MQRIDAESLSRLIHMIYAAATDPTRWPDFLNQFATTVNSSGTALFMHDFSDSSLVTQDGSIALMENVRFDPAFIESYATYYSTQNVWTDAEDTMRPGTAITSEMLVPLDRLLKSEFYGDWLRPQDLRHALGGVVTRSGTQAIKFSSIRSKRAGEFNQEELQLYGALLPHIRQAFEIHKQFARLRAEHNVQKAAVDSMPMGVWFCRTNCTIASSNRIADQITVSNMGLEVDRTGRLRAQLPQEDVRLQHALSVAAGRSGHPSSRVGSVLGVARIGSPTPMSLTITPVNDPTPGLEPGTALVVFGSDPDHGLSTPDDFLQKIYGLTKQQARLAGWLMRGEDLKAYARQHDIAYDTARSHLKQIFSKTGVTRQTDLVRVLLSSPAATVRII
jgi:DNA-binding CsgD family transcriptional regulator